MQVRGFLKSEYFWYSLIVSFALFFTFQTGTDFLYYYFPTAEYLAENLDFPKKLSLSVVDAPMAYPPIEFILIALFYKTMGYIGVKIYYILKIFLFFYLFYELSKIVKNKNILNLFILTPTFLMFLPIFNTDINIAIASIAIILYFKDENRYFKIMLFGVSFGLLSKYTFLPIYLSVLFYAVLFKYNYKKLLYPLIFYIPFLLKNYFYYGNPFFPLFSELFFQLDQFQKDLLSSWTTSGLNLNSFALLFQTVIFSSLLFLQRNKKILVVSLFIFLNILLLEFKSGSSIRFMYPFILIVLFYIANQETSIRIKYFYIFTIVLNLFGLILISDMQIRFYLIIQIIYLLFLVFGFNLNRFLLMTLLLTTSLKIYKKHQNFLDEGYLFYPQYKTIKKFSKDFTIVTDWNILPYELKKIVKLKDKKYYSIFDENFKTEKKDKDILYKKK